LADHREQPIHLHDFLELLVNEPLQKALREIIALLDRLIHQAGDLPRDLLFPFERGPDRIFG
jgi:hypothetical protein